MNIANIVNIVIPILCALIAGVFGIAGRKRVHADAAIKYLDLSDKMKNVDGHCSTCLQQQAKLEIMQDGTRFSRTAATWLYPSLALPIIMHLALCAQTLRDSNTSSNAPMDIYCFIAVIVETLTLVGLAYAFVAAEKEKHLEVSGDCETVIRNAINACVLRVQVISLVMFAAAGLAYAINSFISYEFAQVAIMVVMSIELFAALIASLHRQ